MKFKIFERVSYNNEWEIELDSWEQLDDLFEDYDTDWRDRATLTHKDEVPDTREAVAYALNEKGEILND